MHINWYSQIWKLIKENNKWSKIFIFSNFLNNCKNGWKYKYSKNRNKYYNFKVKNSITQTILWRWILFWYIVNQKIQGKSSPIKLNKFYISYEVDCEVLFDDLRYNFI